MLKLYLPQYEDLWFRKMLMNDDETMSYNHAYGGTIDFSEEKWLDWYNCWVNNSPDNRFYRYIQDLDTKEFVGEVAYHFDGKEYISSIIIYSKYRRKGFGKEGLIMLCKAAKDNGIECIFDDIAIDNPAVELFKRVGFMEEYRTDEIIMLKNVCRKATGFIFGAIVNGFVDMFPHTCHSI